MPEEVIPEMQPEPSLEVDGVLSDAAMHAEMTANEGANLLSDRMAADVAREMGFSEEEISNLLHREPQNYVKFYNDESYLLGEVGPLFRQNGSLTAPDFYMILIWKATRAKTYHRERLKSLVPTGDFRDAVSAIARQLHEAATPEERMRVLMTKWGFYLATASAILTILWPEEFTVYDYRVAEQLKLGEDLSQRAFSSVMWTEYKKFVALANSSTPSGLSLRDKDRWLTGKSYREQVEEECSTGHA